MLFFNKYIFFYKNGYDILKKQQKIAGTVTINLHWIVSTLTSGTSPRTQFYGNLSNPSVPSSDRTPLLNNSALLASLSASPFNSRNIWNNDTRVSKDIEICNVHDLGLRQSLPEG